MQQALAHRAPVGGMMGRSCRGRTVRVNAATQQAVKTPDKFIPPWRDCFGVLQQKGLRTVDPKEAKQLMDKGDWVLIDVR